MAIVTWKKQKVRKERTSISKTAPQNKKGNAKELSEIMSKVPSLNDNQQRFASIYASHPMYRGNWTMSYALTYGWIEDGDTQIDNTTARDTCKTNASRMLKDDRICAAVRNVLDTMDLNDVAVDSKLAFLIHQTEDKWTSLGAVKEYYRITNRGNANAQSPQTLIQNLYMQIVQGNAPKEVPEVP